MKHLLFTERGLLLSVAPNTKNKIALDNPLHTTFLFCRAAELHNIPLPIKSGRPEYDYRAFLDSSKEVMAHYEKINPDFYLDLALGMPDKTIPDCMLHADAFCFNLWLGCPDDIPVVSFKANFSLSEIISHLYEGYPVLMLKTETPEMGLNRNGEHHLSLLTGLIYKHEAIKNLDLTGRAGQNTLKRMRPNYFVFDDLQGKESIVPYYGFLNSYFNLNSEKKFAYLFNPLASLYLPRR